MTEPEDLQAIQDAGGLPEPTLDDDGACDNFALEYHIKIKFGDTSAGGVAAYEITEVSLDVVYGKITPDASDPTKKYTIPRKTSITFYEDDRFRLNSGSPGYLRGLPIKTGKSSGVQTVADGDGEGKRVEWVNEPVSGFYLRGADNEG